MTNIRYRALSLMDRGNHQLAETGESVEEMRTIIDLANTRARMNGYKAERWIITRETTYSKYSKVGVYLYREIREESVEIYPPTLDS